MPFRLSVAGQKPIVPRDQGIAIRQRRRMRQVQPQFHFHAVAFVIRQTGHWRASELVLDGCYHMEPAFQLLLESDQSAERDEDFLDRLSESCGRANIASYELSADSACLA